MASLLPPRRWLAAGLASTRPGRDPRALRQANPIWDFRGEDTKYATHGIFRYPAMMVAPVVRRLIDEYGQPDRTGRLLDPFCGSGSALVEAMLHGMASSGVDLNPFATLLAKVKTTPLDPSELRRAHVAIATRYDEVAGREPEVDLPTLRFWFSTQAIRNLSRLRSAIQEIRPAEVRAFFEMCLAEAARYVSWTRRDEYKVFRIPEEKRRAWRPDVLASFARIVSRNVERMADFASRLPTGAPRASVVAGDVRLPGAIPGGQYDMIVTSPPYGDSRTTVAYGQFSSLCLAWLGYDRKSVNAIDRASLGGVPVQSAPEPPASTTLARHLKEIGAKDPTRAAHVASFYADLCVAFRNVAGVLSPGGRACVVVGNRTVKGVRLETDVILSELLENECGLVHQETIVRGIPNKVMPLRNSPSNVPGAVGDTMANEYILILKRPNS
jgi:site-specific DNA-methyltransferase (cytosine-N4-specific)